MSIEVCGLTKIYGEQKAIDNISFKLNNSEIVGFLGPNGAGKSTTMKIITGYLKPNAGGAFVCGLNVMNKPIEIKKKIGYLPEGNPLYHEMYVREYLSFIAGIHHIQQAAFNIQRVIEVTGLSPESKKKIGHLSKGYKQRVGLAAALIHDPEVLILDEPTSGLDPNQIIEIREVIKKLGQNKTVLFSTHILQEVEAICDRIIIINKGNIVADDKLINLQAQANDHVVLVTFKEKINTNFFEEFRDVIKVEELQNFTFKFQTTKPESVRKQIMEFSLKRNYNILSLQDQNQSLEEVFKNLTTNNKSEISI